MKTLFMFKKRIFYPTITITLFLTLFSVGCACFSISLIEKTKALDETVISGKGRDKILLMDISGVLSNKGKQSFLPFQKELSIVSRIREELKKAAKDKRIKGLVMRINSPGGMVTASDIIYREIVEFKKERKIPVVACIMDLAASGGYYVALSADTIIAHPTSVTGSIGVIALKFNAKGLMEKIGIEDETIKAGDKKDLWSPFRPNTEEEREILQNLLNSFHKRFIKVVAKGRKELSMEQIKMLADGRVFSAKQAVDQKLIDKIGYLDDAIELVKRKAGIDKAKVIVYHRSYSYKNNIYSRMMDYDFKNINLVHIDLCRLLDDMKLKFMYLWLP